MTYHRALSDCSNAMRKEFWECDVIVSRLIYTEQFSLAISPKEKKKTQGKGYRGERRGGSGENPCQLEKSISNVLRISRRTFL